MVKMANRIPPKKIGLLSGLIGVGFNFTTKTPMRLKIGINNPIVNIVL